MARKKPIPRSARKEINRGTLRSRGSDNTKNLSVGLMDIDGAIMFYFNNVIKPVVQENDESVKVPIMYSNPERWNTIQKEGYLNAEYVSELWAEHLDGKRDWTFKIWSILMFQSWLESIK